MVYLCCFDKPIHHAKHYLGSTGNLHERIKRHRNGTSRACLPRAFHKLGIGFTVTRTWEGGFELEKELKKLKNNRKLCPRCMGEDTYENLLNLG